MVKQVASIFLALSAGVFSHCNSGQGPQGQSSRVQLERAPTHLEQVKGSSGRQMRLRKHEVKDSEGTGVTALTYLLPADWTVRERLYWDYRDVFIPVRYVARSQSSDGTMRTESFADVGSTWMQSPSGVQGIRPPASIIEGLKHLIGQQRPVPGLRFTAEKLIPSVQQPVTQQGGVYGQTKWENGIVRVEYPQRNEMVEEEFYGSLSVVRTASQGAVYLETIGWKMCGLASCASPKGHLEECRRIALTVRGSCRLTLAFYNRFVQVTNLLQDQAYAKIYQAGQISRIISQTNDQISRTISESYWNSQKTNDRVNQQFGDYVRGVDRYNDGSGSEWQLPSGYDNAWVNNKGEYLMSDQPGFDPNVTLKEDWRPLKRNE